MSAALSKLAKRLLKSWEDQPLCFALAIELPTYLASWVCRKQYECNGLFLQCNATSAIYHSFSVVWFECEMSPLSLYVGKLPPQLEMLFGKVLELPKEKSQGDLVPISMFRKDINANIALELWPNRSQLTCKISRKELGRSFLPRTLKGSAGFSQKSRYTQTRHTLSLHALGFRNYKMACLFFKGTKLLEGS